MQKSVNIRQLQGMLAGKVKESVDNMTPEQKQEQFMRMAQQKLESYATGIVFNMVQGRGGMVNEEQGKDIVRTAVSMAYEMLNEIHGIRRSED